MNRQKWTLLLVALAFIGGTTVALVRLKTNQQLGRPGITTFPIPGSKRLEVYLPPKVLDYNSISVPTVTNILDGLPRDTSFAERRYSAPDGKWVQCNVVLMGSDRTSIHKPQFCLTGSGWAISGADSSPDTVRVERPYPYDLPVMKLVTSRSDVMLPGRTSPVTKHGIFVYWFVADKELTESHWERMRRMSTHLLATGELERWAYVFCWTACDPGEEAKTYDQLKKFIAASVPEFQKTAGAPVARPVSPQAALH